MTSVRIGIDLGGTKIEGVAFDPHGAVIAQHRVPTPHNNAEDILTILARLVSDIDEEVKRHGFAEPGTVGIGTPGSVSPVNGRLRNAYNTPLNGLELESALGRALGRPVRLANDARCFALSEATDGAGKGKEIVFGAILGTGVGSGIIIRGRPLIGENAIAGEWGHNPLPWPQPDRYPEESPGPLCSCGKHGCIEKFLSGPALAADYSQSTGKSLDSSEIFAALDTDAAARATVERYLDRLARALAHIINILDPQIIVLGGGMSKQHLLYEEVPKRWGEWIYSDTVTTQLVPPVHGDASGVRGAAWLWNAP